MSTCPNLTPVTEVTGLTEVISSGSPTLLPNNISEGNYSVSGNVIRAPQGYLFEGSWVFSNNNEDMAYVNTTNTDIDSWKTHDGGINTIPENCEPLSIVDSDKEYNPLTGNITDDSQLVTCNEGYVFDHDLKHRTGHVKCAYLPKMGTDTNDDGVNDDLNDDLRTKNEMAWVVATDNDHDNDYFENICSRKSTLFECEDARDPLEDDDSSEPIGCIWSQGYENNGFSKEGECLYRKRVDYNHTDPICKPMHCQRKEVRFSNRVDEIDGPLPGPDTERIHGSCINFDGQIIDNITNSSDCNCFKHKSCDICTEGGNDCQWCGYDKETGEGGFCYSTKTHLDICKTGYSGDKGPIQNDRGGTCINRLTGENKPVDEGSDEQWTRISCETNTCANKYNWQHGITDITNLSINEVVNDIVTQVNKDRDDVSRDECLNLNNRWDEHGAHNYDDKCFVSNNKVKDIKEIGFIGNYYPIYDQDNNVTFNTSEYICIPSTTDSITTGKISTCDAHKNKSECEPVDNTDNCSWIHNPLRDSLFHWSDQSKINFMDMDGDSGDSCPISNSENGYNVLPSSNMITINVPSNIFNDNFSDTYNQNCPITTGDFYGVNLFDTNNCNNIDGYRLDTPLQCEDGQLYCGENMKILNEPTIKACREEDIIQLPNGLSGCLYDVNDTNEEATNSTNNCHSTLVEPLCTSLAEPTPYNCINRSITEKRDENRDNCMVTGYEVDEYVDITDSNREYVTRIVGDIFNPAGIKNFSICNTSPLSTDNTSHDEQKCEFIGEDNAHYGGYCSKTITTDNGESTYKLPMKYICESMVGYEWTKQVDSSVNSWKCLNSENEPISDQNVCDLINLVNTYVSTGTNDPNDRKWVVDDQGDSYCANNDNSRITDSDINENSCPSIDTRTWIPNDDGTGTCSGDITITDENLCRDMFNGNKWIAASDKKCFVDNNDEDDRDESTLNYICTKFNKHSVGYTFITSESMADFTGSCNPLDPNPDESRLSEVNNIRDKLMCEKDNNIYIKKYNYTDMGSCESIGEDRLINQPDINTIWEGGEITSDGEGGHTSECSASLLSSCNVDCNPGYGGGGEYICHYNNDAEEICDKVDSMDIDELNDISKGDLCERYPNCTWLSVGSGEGEGGDEEGVDRDNGTCSPNPSSDPGAIHGHLEWLGSECYKLNNDAFSHGIAEIPRLDELFPPFLRILFIIGVIFACIPLFFLVIRPLFKTFGLLLDLIWNTIGWILGVTINMNLQGTDLLPLFLNKFKYMIKLGFTNVILLFIIIPGITVLITYYLYEWSEEYTNTLAAKLVSFFETGITELFDYLADLINKIKVENYENSNRREDENN